MDIKCIVLITTFSAVAPNKTRQARRTRVFAIVFGHVVATLLTVFISRAVMFFTNYSTSN